MSPATDGLRRGVWKEHGGHTGGVKVLGQICGRLVVRLATSIGVLLLKLALHAFDSLIITLASGILIF